MKKLSLIIIWVLFLFISHHYTAISQDELKTWKEFVSLWKEGKITEEKVHPYYENLKKPLLGFLKNIRDEAKAGELDAIPEIFPVENKIHYLLESSAKYDKVTYCYSLIIEEDEWYFHHLEAIFIRLDKVTSFPASTFPDLPEERKAWMRQEIFWSKQVRLFNLLAKEKGKEFAFDWFKDGNGYFLGAKTWVPFVPASKAFILYLCWMEANLYGNSVTLEKLDNSEALVKMTSQYLLLYVHTGHLRTQISIEDYRKIFESIWNDRAEKAGWILSITYDEKGECVFHFKKEN